MAYYEASLYKLHDQREFLLNDMEQWGGDLKKLIDQSFWFLSLLKTSNRVQQNYELDHSVYVDPSDRNQLKIGMNACTMI